MFHYSLDTIDKDIWGVNLTADHMNQMNKILSRYPYNDAASIDIHYKSKSTEANPEQLLLFYNVDGRSYKRTIVSKHFDPKPLARRSMTVYEWCEVCNASRLTWFKYRTWEHLITEERKYVIKKCADRLYSYTKRYPTNPISTEDVQQKIIF